MEKSGEGHIDVRRDQRPQGAVAYVTIDHPAKLNAMNRALMRAFVETMTGLASDAELRAVVLAGAGPKAFVGGADITEMAAISSPEEARPFIALVHECCDAVRAVPVPVIARLHGFTFGAGLELAASCDLRVAAETAIFGMPEVKLGIPSVVEAALLPMLIGWGRTRQLLLLGGNFTAKDAQDWNFVERVVDDDALDQAIEDWVGMLVACPPRAVREQKKLIRQWEDLPLRAAIQAGIDSFAATFENDEPKVAMRDFLAARQNRKRRSVKPGGP